MVVGTGTGNPLGAPELLLLWSLAAFFSLFLSAAWPPASLSPQRNTTTSQFAPMSKLTGSSLTKRLDGCL